MNGGVPHLLALLYWAAIVVSVATLVWLIVRSIAYPAPDRVRAAGLWGAVCTCLGSCWFALHARIMAFYHPEASFLSSWVLAALMAGAAVYFLVGATVRRWHGL